MTEFRLKGKEMIIKTVKPHGKGAMAYVPKAWVGEKVAIIRGINNED